MIRLAHRAMPNGGRQLFGKRRVSEDPVVNLARCIAFCDDLRAYRRGDLAEMDETFEALQKTRFREHHDMWVKVRPLADKIVNMPLRVGGVKWMIGSVGWARLIGRFALIAMIVLVALQIVPIWQNVVESDTLKGQLLLFTLLFALAAAVLLTMGSVLDYTIRKRIIAYEDSTMKEYAPARDKMKDCVNKMMRTLARETERGTETPESLSMVLNFGDYDNVEVVAKWQPKSMWLIKKAYNRYQVNPRP